MRDTLRKKPTKPDPIADDVTSISGESVYSVAANPWVEAQAGQDSEPVLRQTSTPSHGPAPSKHAREPSDTTLNDLQPVSFLKNSRTDDSLSPSIKATRRRKTVNKTPHTFELADDLKPTRPRGSDPFIEEQKPEASSLPISSLESQTRPPEVTPILTRSELTTTVDVKPKKASSDPPRLSQSGPNAFTINHHRRQSSSVQVNSPIIPASNSTRFSPPKLGPDSFQGKVIVLVQGASPIGASIVRSFHASGACVILGDSNADAARRLVKSLSEPHLVHFNKCDARRYADLVELFKLALTMYGKVDHAILGVGEDGGGPGGLAEGEKGWFEHATKGDIDAVEHEPPDLVDTLGTAVRFAHIALAYLRHTPKGKSKRDSVATKPQPDRSLTFLTSIACFKEMPGLPIYQVAQHGVIGLMRSLRSSIEPEKDGVRVNAVVTGMMVPRAFGGSGGRMSVKLPSDMPEDVGRAVVGIAAAGSAKGANGVWDERGDGRGLTDNHVHGRAIYVVGGECWDIQDGLDKSEQTWLGVKPSEFLKKAQEGIGRQSQWIFL